MTFLVEVVVDGRMNRGKFLQTLHLSEAEHGAFSSSKRQMGILGAIFQPAAGCLFLCVAESFHRSTKRSQLVRHDNFRLAVAFHRFSEEFHC